MRIHAYSRGGAVCLLAGLALVGGCQVNDRPDEPEPSPGGETTISDATSQAFHFPAPNLDSGALAEHVRGDLAFEATFVTAPAPFNGGLGPVFNNNSCSACHLRDGRGRPPAEGESIGSMLMRLSVPGADGHGGPLPAPGFGGQLQTRSILGERPEAQVRITYRDSAVAFADGDSATLAVPSYQLTEAYTALPPGLLYSPRVASAVFGMGLLAAIPEADIEAHADPDDRDGDGISGRVNRVYDAVTGRMAAGRFGWKANTPGLLQQSAAAYGNDMGITTWLFPEETCPGQSPGCGPTGPEVDSATLAAVTFYVETLAVPARRNADDDEVKGGARIFAALRCDACHVPRFTTGTLPGVPAVSNQKISPFTDLLVHDMGAGLSDHRPDYEASGDEWRTAPLWGIGLQETVDGHTRFLHDGRARDLQEAILWHGGEAEASREGFRKLARADRAALLAFLASL